MAFAVTDFQADVVEASRERPVLVDFWAPWCGPCRTLGPTLERLAEEQADRWTLVKVNTDEHPDLARRYGVRGIPAVKLFADGTVTDEFTGALPEHALRKWLDEHLPTEASKRVRRAQEALAAGDEETAAALLRDALDDDPTHDAARVLLARTVLFDDPAAALKLLDETGFPGGDLLPVKDAVAVLARLLTRDAEALPEADARADYRDAARALGRQDFDAALEHLIAVVRADRSYDDDGARKVCVALFTILPTDHPAVRAHRRTFDRSLY